MTPSAHRPIFLVGFMGCGKTTVARELALRLGWSFVDIDERIEAREGTSIPEIFRDSGEGHFRRVEALILEESARSEHVISAGGGAFLSATNRRAMFRAGVTVWLDASLELVRARLGEGLNRPLWDPADPVSQRAFFERRRAVYALAGLRITVAEAGPEAVVERIRAEIPLFFV